MPENEIITISGEIDAVKFRNDENGYCIQRGTLCPYFTLAIIYYNLSRCCLSIPFTNCLNIFKPVSMRPGGNLNDKI